MLIYFYFYYMTGTKFPILKTGGTNYEKQSDQT